MFKKSVIVIILSTLTNVVSAADYVSVGLSNSKDVITGKYSDVQYIRAGKEINGLQYDLQSRVALNSSKAMFNSIDVTVGKSFGNITPFIGVGKTESVAVTGFRSYKYGVVGAKTVINLGLGTASLGLKTRFLNTETNTDETILYTSYSVPLTNTVSLGLNLSKTYQDIKKEEVGINLNIKF
jgi:uncharacterized SAM-dependent methyltransferase